MKRKVMGVILLMVVLCTGCAAEHIEANHPTPTPEVWEDRYMEVCYEDVLTVLKDVGKGDVELTGGNNEAGEDSEVIATADAVTITMRYSGDHGHLRSVEMTWDAKEDELACALINAMVHEKRVARDILSHVRECEPMSMSVNRDIYSLDGGEGFRFTAKRVPKRG